MARILTCAQCNGTNWHDRDCPEIEDHDRCVTCGFSLADTRIFAGHTDQCGICLTMQPLMIEDLIHD